MRRGKAAGHSTRMQSVVRNATVNWAHEDERNQRAHVHRREAHVPAWPPVPTYPPAPVRAHLLSRPHKALCGCRYPAPPTVSATATSIPTSNATAPTPLSRTSNVH